MSSPLVRAIDTGWTHFMLEAPTRQSHEAALSQMSSVQDHVALLIRAERGQIFPPFLVFTANTLGKEFGTFVLTEDSGTDESYYESEVHRIRISPVFDRVGKNSIRIELLDGATATIEDVGACMTDMLDRYIRKEGITHDIVTEPDDAIIDSQHALLSLRYEGERSLIFSDISYVRYDLLPLLMQYLSIQLKNGMRSPSPEVE